jgi:hypothetical protein
VINPPVSIFLGWQKSGKKKGITNIEICNPLIILVEHIGVFARR